MAADALGGGGQSFAADDDPELVREALPFALKTIEGLLERDPENEGLLLAAASGFTQYAYAFIQQDAEMADAAGSKAQPLYQRARKLYGRARRYGLSGLEARHEGFTASFAENRAHALEATTTEDVPFLYWTAAAWAAQIAISKQDLQKVGELPEMEALLNRALELDEAFDAGAIHEVFITYDGGRSQASGGSVERARQHMHRALELSNGMKVAPFVTWAEVVSVGAQNREEFNQMLETALAFDVDSAPQYRLANIIAQRRAERLQARTEDLFWEE
ncbi:MAG: hypothetical protein A2289_12185 [Deltaproteobacteria bacterium RIFOXYA12_FULL_58_15]|nr:MAG: hypothetical protein A2289_12185 [Deltaproteobacteria bacterium RIFOXYA12_FULL_58_15]